jgi:uncharacterized protein involved in type VI secretion and phage assembly
MSAELDLFESIATRQSRTYAGKYRAFVVDNRDPERRGRLRLRVPSLLAEAVTDWALPCFPFGGTAGQGWLSVPAVDAQVLCEFIEGDLSAPVWSGTFWRSAEEVPEEVDKDEPSLHLFKTAAGHTLSFEDREDGEVALLRSAKHAEVRLDEKGSITLTGRDGATVTLDADSGELTVADANGNAIKLDSGGLSASDSSGNRIETAASGIKVSSSATVTIEGAQVALAGSGGEPLVKGNSFMALFNAHTHAGPGSPPVTPMTPLQLSWKTTSS